MQTDMNKLRGKLAERGMTQEELASKIGVDPSTFTRKMKSNGLAFTVGQLHKIADALTLTPDDAKHIFLQ